MLFIVLTPVFAGASATPTILVVGDSLSAGHGVARGEVWVDLLRRRLEESGCRHEVINASISGDTTRGGRARLPKALERHAPDLVILELGGNDGLRGIDAGEMRRNLEAMVRAARDAGARVLMLAVRLPPNYGPDFIERFRDAYRSVARETGVAWVPRFLEGVGDRPELMQSDGIHPAAEAQEKMLDNVWQGLVPLLQDRCPVLGGAAREGDHPAGPSSRSASSPRFVTVISAMPASG